MLGLPCCFARARADPGACEQDQALQLGRGAPSAAPTLTRGSQHTRIGKFKATPKFCRCFKVLRLGGVNTCIKKIHILRTISLYLQHSRKGTTFSLCAWQSLFSCHCFSTFLFSQEKHLPCTGCWRQRESRVHHTFIPPGRAPQKPSMNRALPALRQNKGKDTPKASQHTKKHYKAASQLPFIISIAGLL